MAEQILEGTWEEILCHADELAGHRLRVVILDDQAETNGADKDENPNALPEAIRALLSRPPEEIEAARARLFEQSRAPRPLPEGKTLGDVVCGQWPGDETDEAVFEALKKLS